MSTEIGRLRNLRELAVKAGLLDLARTTIDPLIEIADRPERAARHLHIVREQPPKPAKGYRIYKLRCPGCPDDVYLIHFDREGIA